MESVILNDLLTDNFRMEVMLIRQGPRKFYALTGIMY